MLYCNPKSNFLLKLEARRNIDCRKHDYLAILTFRRVIRSFEKLSQTKDTEENVYRFKIRRDIRYPRHKV